MYPTPVFPSHSFCLLLQQLLIHCRTKAAPPRKEEPASSDDCFLLKKKQQNQKDWRELLELEFPQLGSFLWENRGHLPVDSSATPEQMFGASDAPGLQALIKHLRELESSTQGLQVLLDRMTTEEYITAATLGTELFPSLRQLLESQKLLLNRAQKALQIEPALGSFFRCVADRAANGVSYRAFSILIDLAQEVPDKDSLDEEFPNRLQALVVLRNLFANDCHDRNTQGNSSLWGEVVWTQMEDLSAILQPLKCAKDFRARFVSLTRRSSDEGKMMVKLHNEVLEEKHRMRGDDAGGVAAAAAAQKLLAPIAIQLRLSLAFQKKEGESEALYPFQASEMLCKKVVLGKASPDDLKRIAADEQCFTHAAETIERVFSHSGARDLRQCLREAVNPFGIDYQQEDMVIMRFRDRLARQAERCRLATRLASLDAEYKKLIMNENSPQSTPLLDKMILQSLIEEYEKLLKECKELESSDEYLYRLLNRLEDLRELSMSLLDQMENKKRLESALSAAGVGDRFLSQCANQLLAAGITSEALLSQATEQELVGYGLMAVHSMMVVGYFQRQVLKRKGLQNQDSQDLQTFARRRFEFNLDSPLNRYRPSSEVRGPPSRYAGLVESF